MARRFDKDRVLVARLDGVAQRAVREGWPIDQAVAEIRSVTDRPDLLAEAAGIRLGGWIGAHMHRLDPRGVLAAGLIVLAGSDPDAIVDAFERGRDNVRDRGPRPGATGPKADE